MPIAYKKAPAFRGKDVVLSIGRSQMRIEDGREYTDQRLRPFVRHGFLVEVQQAEVVAPAEAPAPAPVASEPEVPAVPAVAASVIDDDVTQQTQIVDPKAGGTDHETEITDPSNADVASGSGDDDDDQGDDQDDEDPGVDPAAEQAGGDDMGQKTRKTRGKRSKKQ